VCPAGNDNGGNTGWPVDRREWDWSVVPDEDLDVLRGAWAGLCAVTGVARHELAFGLIALAYSEPHRHYHNTHHVAECFRELDPVRQTCARPLEVDAALLFHDYLYDPTRHDNEDRSADEAASALRALGWTTPAAQAVRELIRATKHASEPATADAAIVADVDLAILGKAQAEFEAYERAVRREYEHVPEPAYRAGRATVLRQFLGRPQIYVTDYFAGKYEMAARQNLGQSVAALEQ
jgi:predicted metal-dependent HD superfamily phosphohydrolase